VAKLAGLELVDVPIKLPEAGISWAMAGLVSLLAEFGDVPEEQWELLTDELRFGMVSAPHYRARHGADLEKFRTTIVEATADVFEQVDFVLCATNPWEPFVAEGPTPSVCGDVPCSPFNAGALTIPANITGYPAVTIPTGPDANGRPVGLQVIGRRHEEALLLDLALLAERERPWPLVAPTAPV
jgi:aspartyl-tRNA(Asn)/glutamyl-tRNA(Gln) amidotransferase subunit A